MNPMKPISRFVAEVNVDLDEPDGDQILTNITDWILAHPLVVAVVLVTAFLARAVKNRTIRSGMIFVGGILFVLFALIPFGVID